MGSNQWGQIKLILIKSAFLPVESIETDPFDSSFDSFDLIPIFNSYLTPVIPVILGKSISNKLSANYFSHLFLLGFLLFFSVPTTSFANEPPVLTLSSAGMTIDGPLPTYAFEIYADGTVHYHGDIKVNVIGDRQAKITPQQVQQLIMTYKKIDQLFKKMQRMVDYDTYVSSIPRHSPYLFRLQYQGEISKIHPGGFAHDMLANLNKMIPIKSWVCFPEEGDFSCPVIPMNYPSVYPID